MNKREEEIRKEWKEKSYEFSPTCECGHAFVPYDDILNWFLSKRKEELEEIVEGMRNRAWPGKLNAKEPEDDYQRGWNEALDTYRGNINYELDNHLK